MATTTLPDDVTHDGGDTRPPPTEGRDATGAGFVTTALVTSRRSVLQFFRTPQILMMGSIQGALFLLMFRYVFGKSIHAPGAPFISNNYVHFLVPGFLVTVSLWTGMAAAAGVAEDSSTGVYDRLRSLPIPRAAVMVGRSMADLILVAWGTLITALVGYGVGFRTHSNPGRVLLAYAVMMIGGYALCWIFITLGLVAGNAQAAQGMSMLVVPFSFVSSANVPVSGLPGWMQPFAANQPVSVMINAVRSLMQGGPANIGLEHSTTYWVVLSLAWSAGIFVVFGAIAVRKFAKTK